MIKYWLYFKSMTKYSHKKTFRSPVIEHELTKDCLKITNTKNGKHQNIYYQYITEINLCFVPGVQHNPDKYMCTIFTKGDKVILTSIFMKSLLDIIHQDKEYTLFVKTLHQKTFSHTNVQYIKGAGKALFYVGKAVFIIGAILLGGLGIVGIIKGKYQVTVICGLGAIFLGLGAKSAFQSYKPEIYDPLDIRENLLPYKE